MTMLFNPTSGGGVQDVLGGARGLCSGVCVREIVGVSRGSQDTANKSVALDFLYDKFSCSADTVST